MVTVSALRDLLLLLLLLRLRSLGWKLASLWGAGKQDSTSVSVFRKMRLLKQPPAEINIRILNDVSVWTNYFLILAWIPLFPYYVALISDLVAYLACYIPASTWTSYA